MHSTTPKKISILIADDHALISEAIATVLAAHADFEATTVNSGHAAFAALNANTAFDIVMLDIDMPGMRGIDSVRDLIKLAAPGFVVIFSAFASSTFVRSAISAGARGFVPKTMSLGALASILRLISSGQIFVPMETTLSIVPNAEASLLSEREKAVMNYVSHGKSNKEVATGLGLTEMTVKMVMRSVCKKLSANNRTEAAMMYKNMT